MVYYLHIMKGVLSVVLKFYSFLMSFDKAVKMMRGNERDYISLFFSQTMRKTRE